MIEINLLPDVKQEFLKAEQTKHTVLVGSIIASIAVLSITILFFAYVQVAQPQYQKTVQKDIDSGMLEIKSKPNAKRIVTVQGVLEQVPALKDKQQVTSRLFSHLTQFTPRSVKYDKVNLDFTSGKLTLAGSTVSYEKANVLANNLKSAKYKFTKAGSEQSIVPFSGIVFSNLGKSESADNGNIVSFEISMQFDPQRFDPSVSKQSIKVNASSEELLLPEEKPLSENALGVME